VVEPKTRPRSTKRVARHTYGSLRARPRSLEQCRRCKRVQGDPRLWLALRLSLRLACSPAPQAPAPQVWLGRALVPCNPWTSGYSAQKIASAAPRRRRQLHEASACGCVRGCCSCAAGCLLLGPRLAHLCSPTRSYLHSLCGGKARGMQETVTACQNALQNGALLIARAHLVHSQNAGGWRRRRERLWPRPTDGACTP
jgi:hypothetical protein